MRVTKLVLVVSVLSLLISSVSPAVEIEIVDYADQWPKVDALWQTLDEFKIKYDDYTKNVEKGTLTFKVENKLFFIGCMPTNNPNLHQGLDKNANAIQDFAKIKVGLSSNLHKRTKTKLTLIGYPMGSPVWEVTRTQPISR